MIYLYVKTHNTTGLKYLGKTIQNPFIYRGSGIHWLRHIKKHGYNVTTQILLATECKEELKETGIFFSKLFSIVKSKEWANLTEETGDGGDLSLFIDWKAHTLKMRKIWKDPEYRKKLSKIHRKKISDGTHHWLGDKNPVHEKVANGTHHFQCKSGASDMRKKGAQTSIKNGTCFPLTEAGRKMSAETSKRRLGDGSHNLIGMVSVISKNGNNSQISREFFHSQSGPKENWEYVANRSNEGKRRKKLLI